MNRSSRRWTKVAALPLTAVLVLSSCGSSESEETAGGGEQLDGEIFISGSSTVEPISVIVGEGFEEKFGLAPDVEGPGTGDGFKKFCAGETDISDASREIKDEEAAACEAAGVEFVGLPVALDAMAVVTAKDNDAVTCLTLADLYGLVGPESEGVAKWSDAKQFGATTDLPDADLDIVAPGPESGTYDSFFELAIKDIAEERLGDELGDKALRTDYGGLANDNEILSGLGASPTSLGWVGFAFANGSDEVHLIDVDGGSGCVTPSAETAADGSYPLSRELFIYVSTTNAAEKPELVEFVDYYLSDEGLAAVEEAGYLSLDAAAVEEARAAWDAAKP